MIKKKVFQRINEFKEPLQGEEWRDIAGWEGVYRISNLGRMMSSKKGYWYVLANNNQKGGYLSVTLEYKDKMRSARMHRLVYETFIGELPNGSKFNIHHIDGCKQNNRSDNLILTTSKEHHFLHSGGVVKTNKKELIKGLFTKNTSGMNHYNRFIRPKKIIQKDINGKFIAIFNNSMEAHLATGVCQRNILQVAHKTPYNKNGLTRKQAGGFVWEIATCE